MGGAWLLCSCGLFCTYSPILPPTLSPPSHSLAQAKVRARAVKPGREERGPAASALLSPDPPVRVSR